MNKYLNPKNELDYLETSLHKVTNLLLIKDIKKGIKNLKLILKGIPFCPCCGVKNVVDPSFQFLGYWQKLNFVTIQGSKRLRIKKLKRWEKDGVNTKKLPNSEWFEKSYIHHKLICPKCDFKLSSEKIPIVFSSDDFIDSKNTQEKGGVFQKQI